MVTDQRNPKRGEVKMIDRDKELCEAVQKELGLNDREMASIIEALMEGKEVTK